MAHPAHHSHAPQARTHAHAGHQGGTSHGPDAADGLSEVLDLDAELFAPYLTTVTGRIAALADWSVRHVVDLGAGTGTGTFALLERFPAARVTAVDSSAGMLTRLAATARERGLGGRVDTLEADAAVALPGLSDVDLVWAAASLHHVADPAAALTEVRGLLRPGGLLTVVEMDGMPRFLPDDADSDRPGLEARCRAALTALHAEQLPHLGADWGSLLTAAGLDVAQEHTEDLALRPPLPSAAGRYAHLVLGRVRSAVDGRVDADDLAALDTLLGGGPQDVRHREDLVVRSTRQIWLARRPADRP